MGSSTENSAFGPSRNPWDPTRVPGGSGGGSAAAVSAGLTPWALGSDTGGSIKQPSALCGNVGLRPTYGTVSRYGIVAFASSLDQVGPSRGRCATARSSTRSSPAATRATRRRSSCPDVATCCRRTTGSTVSGSASRSRLADLAAIEPGVRSAFEQAIELARELGAEVGECDLPLSFEYGMPCYYLVAPAEASSNLARYDGVRYGPRVDGATYREMVERTRDEGFGAEPKRRIMLGTYALSAGYYDAYYGQAQKVRTLLVREHRDALSQFDVIATPTSPTVAFPIGDKAADPLAMYACDLLTIPSCLAGLPGLSIPCGLSEGLPVGLQLIGAQFGENTLFRAGHALERALGFDTRPDEADGHERRELGARDRARDPRPAEDADEDVLPLPGRIRRRREHADVSRSASASRARCRCRTGRRSSGRSSSGSRSAARSRRAPSSRARTTSILTCQRAIRSPSTIYHLA